MIVLITVISSPVISQEKISIYDTTLDGLQQISEAIELAKDQGKHTLIKVGYNQCPWCIKLDGFIKEDAEIDSLIKADYVFIKVNYSKENRNMAAMEFLEYPHRFGFPVMVVIDVKGKRIHTQNTLYLEKKKSYDRMRVINFLKAWNSKAISAESYKKF
jgi:thioredoxin-related protein